jgi:hypothetical protein
MTAGSSAILWDAGRLIKKHGSAGSVTIPGYKMQMLRFSTLNRSDLSAKIQF